MSEKIGFAAAVRAEGDWWDLHEGLAVAPISMVGPAELSQMHDHYGIGAYLRYRPRIASVRHQLLAGHDDVHEGERLEREAAA